MFSKPPETEFYDDAANLKLWRDLHRLREEFMGLDESLWPEKQDAFITVLADVQARMSPGPE